MWFTIPLKVIGNPIRLNQSPVRLLLIVLMVVVFLTGRYEATLA